MLQRSDHGHGLFAPRPFWRTSDFPSRRGVLVALLSPPFHKMRVRMVAAEPFLLTRFWTDPGKGEIAMKLMKTTMVSALVLVIGSSVSFGQTSDTTTTSPSSPGDKSSISKACSDQANQKGLHGKARRTFRAQCKKSGGKPS
jgi:hypothetical protein